MSKKNLAEDGSLITLGLVAVVAAIGEVHRRKGSRATCPGCSPDIWDGYGYIEILNLARRVGLIIHTKDQAQRLFQALPERVQKIGRERGLSDRQFYDKAYAALKRVNKRKMKSALKSSRSTWGGTATIRLSAKADLPAFTAETEEEAWETARKLARELPFSAFEDLRFAVGGYRYEDSREDPLALLRLEVSDVHKS
jgi:hypothetical protein